MNESSNVASRAIIALVSAFVVYSVPSCIAAEPARFVSGSLSNANLTQLEKRVENNEKVADLIGKIEQEWPAGIGRDRDGNVVFITVPVRFLNDNTLRMLSGIKTLRELSFSYRPELGEPSRLGIESLQHALELKCITLQCSGDLPFHVLEAVSTVCQLESLTLLKASPTEAGSFSLLTNLVSLRKLAIKFPTRFGSDEIQSLISISQLQDLEIFSEQLIETDSCALMAHPGLTNLVIRNGGWTLHLTKNAGFRKF